MTRSDSRGRFGRPKGKAADKSLLPFALVKYFAFTSLIVILLAAFALSWLIARNARASLLKRSEAYSRLFADNLNRQVFVQFVLPTVVRYGRIAISNQTQYRHLNEIVNNLTSGMNVKEVTIYDSVNNVVAYSTMRPLMGKRGLGGLEYGKAARGEENSAVISGGSLLSLLPGGPPIFCTMKTFAPFRQETRLGRQTDEILGVIEVEQDISEDMRAIIELQGQVILLSLAIMSLLFAILSLLVVKANRFMARRAEEHIRLEEELNAAQRLAVLGKMVASVSHEIKNPLGIVRSTAEVLAGRIGRIAPGNERLAAIIVEETVRLDRVVREFLDFARPREITRKPGQIQEPADRALAFLHAEFEQAGVEVVRDFAPDLPDVPMDSAHIYQVIFNMAHNALQAMPEGGRLRVETRLAEDGAGVSLILTDTGCGIAPEDLEQIFTPFYTSKSRGTGLGLAIAQGIVEEHGGSITVDSLVDAGSAFTITLPLSPAETDEAARQRRHGTATKRQTTAPDAPQSTPLLSDKEKQHHE